MNEASAGVDAVDLTDRSSERVESDELVALRRRMAELETELEQAMIDVGRLQLQVDLFTSTDPVTGFVNRTGTIDAVQSALDRLDRMDEPVTILVLSIPELGELRASLADADLVGGLRHLGALVAGGLRRVDRVGRLEDDTFVSVLSNLGARSVDVVLGRIEDALTAAPVELGGIVVVEPLSNATSKRKVCLLASRAWISRPVAPRSLVRSTTIFVSLRSASTCAALG